MFLIAQRVTFETFHGETVVHPLGLLALMVAGALVLFGPRSKMLIPIFIFFYLVPSAQRITIATLDFSFIRILLLAAFTRVLFLPASERRITFTGIDLFPILLCVAYAYSGGLRNGLAGGFISQVGAAIDIACSYFLGRFLIRSVEDLKRTLLVTLFAAIPTAMMMLLESSTGRNLFAVFGGISFNTLIREGELRCQGPFAHPILAGLMWGLLLPFVWADFRSSANWSSRTRALVLGFFVTTVVILSRSSTPVLAGGIALVGCVAYPIRNQFRMLKWILLAGIIFLHFAMDKGAHHLLARINVIAGSTGWHRYALMDGAISHMSEWWAVGANSSGHWGRGLQDVTNYFVFHGLQGGIIALGSFCALLVCVLNSVGRAVRQACTNEHGYWIWAGGVFVATASLSFISVTPFGQSIAIFFLILGSVAGASTSEIRLSATLRGRRSQVRREPSPQSPEGIVAANGRPVSTAGRSLP